MKPLTPIQRASTVGKVYDTGMNNVRLILDRIETEASEVILNVFPAGVKTPDHVHPEKEQIFFVLEGTGTIYIKDVVFRVKPGEIILVPRNARHRTDADPGRDLR